MIPKREDHERWIQQYLKRFPELVKEFRACLNGYEKIQSNHRIDNKSLKAIFHAASSSRIPLSFTATCFLSELSTHYAEVREAILKMSDDNHWYVRLSALLSLGRGTPRNFVLVLLKKALQDRSSRVRGLAASRAYSLRVLKIIPDIENQLAREHHPDAKFSMDFHLRLLRDGYFLQTEGRDFSLLWIPIRDGIQGHPVAQKDIDTRGIQTIISEIRRNADGE